MTFPLPDHIRERLAAARQAEAAQEAVFANLHNGDLAASARFWMQHCVAPKRHEPGAPVYDSTFWHVIVPEMIRRLEPQPPAVPDSERRHVQRLERAYEALARAECKRQGIDPDAEIADGGYMAWQLVGHEAARREMPENEGRPLG